jgi:hypothetical protein
MRIATLPNEFSQTFPLAVLLGLPFRVVSDTVLPTIA